MSDAIQVDAEVVEATALGRPEMPTVEFHPAEIDADFDAMLGWATALKAEYEAAEFSEDEGGYREAKAARAAIRTYIKEIDGRRKAVKAEYSAPLVAFEARVKLVTGALGDAADACDAFVKGWEDAGRRRKYDAIRAEYEDFAPLLAPVLPFERFYDLRQRSGRKWANKTPTLPKCLDEMREDVGRVAEDWEAVKALQTGHPDVAEREFFRTLDLGQAMRAAKAADDEDARIAALRAEQERMRAEREAARREHERDMERMWEDAPVVQTPPASPVFEPTPEPTPQPAAEGGTWTIVVRDLSDGAAAEFEAQLREWFGQRVQVFKGEPMDAAIQMTRR